MEQKKSRTPWIVCGVIALVVVCGGVVALVGGFGLLAFITGSGTPTPEVPVALPTATQAALLQNTPAAQDTPSGPIVDPSNNGEIAGVPYKAVVQIIAMVDLEGQTVQAWTGSGSIISPDGLILTNGHVVLSDRYYTVKYLVVAMTVSPDEQPVPTYVAQILQVDEALDIAVIRVETDLEGNPVDRATLNLPTVPLGNSDTLQLGDPVTIIGYPGIGGTTITLTRGDIAGFTAEEGYGNRAFIKTSATIAGGNSGGLAANAKGEIIGIPTQLGYGGDDQYVDCRVLVDTNRDGAVDENDTCVPTGGFINALRPIQLARPYIEAAGRGEVNIQTGVAAEQGEVPQETTSILFQDDFSDANSGWDVDTWENGSVGYENGQYNMTVFPTDYLIWSYIQDDVADLIISADTSVVSPTGVGDYGLICRYTDENNFYGLEVTEDGYFSVWKYQGGEYITLYDWTYSEAIPAGQPFRLDAACVGNRLLLGINDTLLADITDDNPLLSGSYGLVMGTLETGNFTASFDNFVVSAP